MCSPSFGFKLCSWKGIEALLRLVEGFVWCLGLHAHTHRVSRSPSLSVSLSVERAHLELQVRVAPDSILYTVPDRYPKRYPDDTYKVAFTCP